uniref:Uncharacterized protein n=1 Tax=Strigamia maritima TaxID=126957 RepID=T1JBY3_STRMM
MGSWSTKRLNLLKAKKQRKLKRTAMGEYIPSANTSPLTLTAVPTPSAFDYYPNVNKSGPKFSIGKKFRVWKKRPTPGPADYGKLRDFYTPCKAPTMKSRAAFTYLSRREKFQMSDPSRPILPSTLRRNAALISSCPPDTVNVGMLPSYPYPPAGSDNTAGYYAPIPNLEKGVKFGIIPKALTKDEFPGPIYNVPPKFPEGPKFQFLPRTSWPPKITGWDAPAPNTYLPKSQLGKGGKIPRITSRLPSVIQENKVGPGPCRYAAFKPPTGTSKTMGQHALPSRFPRQPIPAPNSYTIEPLVLPKESKTKFQTKFIKLTKPKPRVRGPKIRSRHETMITLRHSAVQNIPSPSIHLCYFKDVKFGSGTPGARIRSRPIEKTDDTKIAPNMYHPCIDPKLKRIPAYTFGHKILTTNAPLTINVEPRPLPSTLELKNHFTFGIPLKELMSLIPAPTKYTVPSTFACMKTQPCHGVSLKSRQTPFAHPGIAKLKIPTTPTRMLVRPTKIFLEKK